MDGMNSAQRQYGSRDLLTKRRPAAPVPIWSRTFPGEPEQVREARRWIESVLPDCDSRFTIVLTASEFCTNALQHTRSGNPGGQFTVHLAWSPGTVRVAVGDEGSSLPPEAVHASLDSEHGRGLGLIDALVSAWGFIDRPDGRLLWADQPWPEAFPCSWNRLS